MIAPPHRYGLKLCALVYALAALLALNTAAFAGAPSPSSDQPVRDVLARNIARIALMDLRLVSGPKAADYKIAAHVLGIAHELAPQDEDLLRKYIEAVYNAGDETLVIELSRRLLDLDPRDSVAYLRLISTTISSRHQLAEDRLRAYEALLGEQGRGLDPAIRSRLALDAALLMRERGDDRGFVEKLTLATQLDMTHKEAAALAANFVAASGQGSAATLESLSVLLMADPVDPNVHLAIARLLCAEGIFEPAQRFHGNAFAIMQAADAVSDALLLENRILDWHVRGPQAVAASLNQELLVAQDAAIRAIRLTREAKQPIDGMQRPEDVRFPQHVAFLAALASEAAGDSTAARGILKAMSEDVARLSETVREAVIREEIEPAIAARTVAAAFLSLQSARLWTGLYLEDAAADHEAIRDILERQSPDALQLLAGWFALREGRPEEAIARLEPLAEMNTMAMIGIAASLEALDDVQGAIEEYKRVVQRAPLEAAGAWSRTRLIALGHVEDRRERARLERIAAGIPSWIDRLISHPREFVQLSARAQATTVDGLSRNGVSITIRNIAPIPLSLGSDRSINSRMLLAPKMEIEGSSLAHMVRPEVVDLDRRLRLMPRESVEALVWADPGDTGWITEVLGNRTVRVRWRIIQGFMMDRAVGYRPGPMSQVSETGQVVRRPLPEASLSPEMLTSRIATDPASALPGLAAAIRARLLQPFFAPTAEDIEVMPPDAAGGQPRQRLRTERMEALRPVIEALADRYTTLDAVHRAALVAIMPHERMSRHTAPLDQVMLADTDPLVMSMVVVTRITDPQDRYLDRAADTGDERLRSLAIAVAERLESEQDFYARVTLDTLVERLPAEDEGGVQR